jgi:flagellar hook-associated protein 1 FlgK
MSLTIALNNAVSGLQVNQTALEITSNNVANAQTEGYSRQIAAPVSLAVDGEGAGVEMGPITREVSQSLIDEVRDQNSAQNFSQATTDILSQLQDSFGNPNDSTSLTSQLANLAATLQGLATTPDGVTQKSQVVAAAQSFTRNINSLAQSVQNLRRDADQQIATAVSDASTQLNTIQQLNSEIQRLLPLNLPVSTLQDQRDLAIKRLGADMDITTLQRPDGTVAVYTKGGKTLLDGNAPTLTHTAVGSVSASISYPAGFNGILLNGVDITTAISGGKIGAYIQLRDQTLPNVAQQLDTLTNTVVSQINALHNAGASVPASNSLASSKSVSAADPFSGTGTVRIAVVDQNGKAVAAPLDLDLTTVVPPTVAGLVAAINAGLGAAGSASVVNGQLVIKASSAGNGIAINQESTNVNGSGSGLSSYFGLNDFFVLGSTGSPAQTIAVRGDIVGNPNIISTGTLSTGALAVGAAAVTPGDNSTVQALANLFNTPVPVPAAGGLSATTSTLGDYAGVIIGAAASQASDAKDTAQFQSTLLQNLSAQATNVSGVNVDQELANLTVYQNAYAASARVVTVINAMFTALNSISTS